MRLSIAIRDVRVCAVGGGLAVVSIMGGISRVIISFLGWLNGYFIIMIRSGSNLFICLDGIC